MTEETVKKTSEDTMCIQHDIEGSIWRFHYQRVDGNWVRYMREKVEEPVQLKKPA